MSDRLIPRAFALGFAAMVTLAMMSGIDVLATTEHAAYEQMAAAKAGMQVASAPAARADA